MIKEKYYFHMYTHFIAVVGFKLMLLDIVTNIINDTNIGMHKKCM
jgi:hypothetical protein